MTAAPGSHVDFSLLTSELRILPIAPSWAEVERAMERLEGALSDDEQTAKDLQTVRDFHRNLEDHREMLALALYCAAFVGAAAPSGTAGERLAAGLRAISKCYQFQQLTGDERLRELQRLSGELPQFNPVVLNPPESLAATDWETWWEPVPEAAGKLAEEDINWAIRPVWDKWLSRLLEYISKGTLAFRPNLADVFGAVQPGGPDRLFRFDLSEMSLADWSDAFHHVSTRGWLNLASPTLLQLIGPLDWDDFQEDWEQWSIKELQTISTTHWTLLVRRQHDSVAQQWPPASVAGLVALDLLQIREDRSLIEDLAPKLVVIELPLDEEGAAAWDVATKYPDQAVASIADQIASLAPSSDGVYLACLAPNDVKMAVPEGIPVIYGAKDADDLLLQVQSLTDIDLTKTTDSEPVKSSKPRKGKTDEDS